MPRPTIGDVLYPLLGALLAIVLAGVTILI